MTPSFRFFLSIVLPFLLAPLPSSPRLHDDNDEDKKSPAVFETKAWTKENSGIVDAALEDFLRQGGNAETPPPINPGETTAQLGHRPPPENVNLGCTGQIQGGMWGGGDICPINFPDEEPEEIPAVDLLYHAIARSRVEGAGLRVQPHIRAYVGVPTLVHASQPTRSETLHILGYDVTVNFSASSYKYDFGDGYPPLVTTDPSGPYPITTLRHVYQEPFPSQTVALETTWTATITHPVTGEVLSVPGVMITRERSAPFEVRKAKGYLTDTAEELRGR